MSIHLVCNYKNCYKEIIDSGYVTSCSHLFCSDHGIRLKENWVSTSCPVCGTFFKDEYSIISRTFNPTSSYRRMGFTGFSPEIIMEMATNAMAFWNYQCSQDINLLKKKVEYYRTQLISKQSERVRKSDHYENVVRSLRHQLEQSNKRVEELLMDLKEKDRIITELDMKQNRSNTHSCYKKRSPKNLFTDSFF